MTTTVRLRVLAYAGSRSVGVGTRSSAYRCVVGDCVEPKAQVTLRADVGWIDLCLHGLRRKCINRPPALHQHCATALRGKELKPTYASEFGIPVKV
jgi:hypothetical protein